LRSTSPVVESTIETSHDDDGSSGTRSRESRGEQLFHRFNLPNPTSYRKQSVSDANLISHESKHPSDDRPTPESDPDLSNHSKEAEPSGLPQPPNVNERIFSNHRSVFAQQNIPSPEPSKVEAEHISLEAKEAETPDKSKESSSKDDSGVNERKQTENIGEMAREFVERVAIDTKGSIEGSSWRDGKGAKQRKQTRSTREIAEDIDEGLQEGTASSLRRARMAKEKKYKRSSRVAAEDIDDELEYYDGQEEDFVDNEEETVKN
jgi:hypothetical protein